MSMTVSCKECGTLLHESETVHLSVELRDRVFPCANCGANSARVETVHTETASHHDSVRYKGKRPGVKKPVVEGRAGADLHRDTGEWRDVRRHIDRTLAKHDEAWYEETVTRPDGEVVRDVSEPLKDHRGRGSAKKRGNTEDA